MTTTLAGKVALVTGGSRGLGAAIATAEIFRRSGSVWTAVVVHVVFNLPTIPVMVAAGMS
jgi:NAD(P)-dependent dehydrogenase (short-subunit alcohol dehydrogenase family)